MNVYLRDYQQQAMFMSVLFFVSGQTQLKNTVFRCIYRPIPTIHENINMLIWWIWCGLKAIVKIVNT